MPMSEAHRAERKRREDAGECRRCGKNPSIDPVNRILSYWYLCQDCVDYKRGPYSSNEESSRKRNVDRSWSARHCDTCDKDYTSRSGPRCPNCLIDRHGNVIDLTWSQQTANVVRSDGDDCVFCGQPATGLDHLWPKSKGGHDEEINLVRACWKPCQTGHDGKHGRTIDLWNPEKVLNALRHPKAGWKIQAELERLGVWEQWASRA